MDRTANVSSSAEAWPVKLIQILAIPGMLLSFYLLLYHSGDLIAVCSGSGWDDCGKVSGPDAPYSTIGSIPVALIGLLGYAAIFLLAWLPTFWPALDDYLPEVMVSVTGLGFLFTLFLTGLELFVIRSLCRYCVVSALIMMAMFVLAIILLRRRPLSVESG
jgi:uncharacterized membrane protein